jgi:hypothetical protein
MITNKVSGKKIIKRKLKKTVDHSNSWVPNQRKWCHYLWFGTKGQPELCPPAEKLSGYHWP